MIKKRIFKRCFNSVKRQTCTKLTDLHTMRWYSVTSVAAIEYKEIDWKKCNSDLKSKQAKIVRAYKFGNEKEVSITQSELVRSFAARALAVRMVTINSKRKISGVDQVIWDTDKKKAAAIKKLSDLVNYKALPVKQHMLEVDGTFKLLEIPIMYDRAVQMLWLFALDPIAEEKSDIRSYGCRPYQGVNDCVSYLHFLLVSKHNERRFILNTNIKNLLSSISHDWLIKNIPMDKRILKQFLKAGFLKAGPLGIMRIEFLQERCISSVIIRMTLDGLETQLGEEYRITRYLDDFVILGKSKNRLKKHALPLVQKFLSLRGLRLDPNKTFIRTVQQGFDFLGFYFRKYENLNLAKGMKKDSFLVIPSKKNVMEYKKKISRTVKAARSSPVAVLINTLNVSLRGWAAYYRAASSTKAFNNISRHVFVVVYKFLRHRYKNVPRKQIVQKHFTRLGNNRWVFFGQSFNDTCLTKKVDKVLLFQIGSVRIKKYMMCKPLNIYDPINHEYFEKRIAQTNTFDLNLKSIRNRLFKKQKGICSLCQSALNNESDLNVYHNLPKKKTRKSSLRNTLLLHRECYEQITHTKMKNLSPHLKQLT